MPSLRRRFLTGFIVLIAVLIGGSAGYWVIGGGKWAFHECVYMTVITVTTVGYGETLSGMDVTPYARGFTMLLLLFGTGAIVFFAGTVTAFVVEGELKDALFQSKLKKRMKRMRDHMIVCGAGSTGRLVIEELLTTGNEVVAIDMNEVELKEIAAKFPKASFAYLVGDATDDDVIAPANVPAARGLVTALSSDKDNLYLVVSARQVNSTMRIVARCAEVAHIERIKRAGADAVVSPNAIGGMRLVSEMVRPAVVGFLDTMLRDKREPYRIEEVMLRATAPEVGGTLRDAKLRDRFGMSVIAVRATATDEWIYNPGAEQKLTAGMVLVVLGSPDQLARIRTELA